MAFSESIKTSVRRRAHFMCCLCKALGVEVHHIVPQEEGGADTEDNAAPLCPSCHETYGGNPDKRKFIRDARDLWYDICGARYGSDNNRLDEIERLLKNIESHTKASTFPLLPFSLFYTLRHTTTDDAIQRGFGNVRGFRSLKSDLLQLVGTVRLGGYGTYNDIEFEPTHSHCTLEGKELEALVQGEGYLGESVIKSPLETTVEFFLSASRESEQPSLVLRKAFVGDGKPWEVKGLALFDDTIFQDVLVTRWEVTNPSRNVWSIASLDGARTRVCLKFISFDDVNLRRPPQLHNLHMYFGHEAPHVLYFTALQLGDPVVMEDPQPLAKWNLEAMGLTAREVLLQYDFHLDETMIPAQLRQVV